MKIPTEPSPEIVQLRHLLHAHPELSEQEQNTAVTVVERLNRSQPSQLLSGLGSMATGICAVFDSGQPGPAVLLRCELDALPIQETNTFAHRSSIDGVSHKCGHDGHMATLIALADDLHVRPIARGRVYLLFQPAEETGTGAQSILADPAFQALPPPDFVYAFHNVPKFPFARVLLRPGLFAQASVGFLAEFTGRTSHSSYPEHGINPADAVTRLVAEVNRFHQDLSTQVSAPVLGTVTHALLGDAAAGPNFGVTPGMGLVSGVIRAQSDEDIQLLQHRLTLRVSELAQHSGLGHQLSWHESFAATRSDAGCTAVVAQAAQALGLEVQELPEAFRWSEDFGYFTARYPGAFFGLGCGEDHPQLHDNRYDYPDKLIPVGTSLYRAIIDLHMQQ